MSKPERGQSIGRVIRSRTITLIGGKAHGLHWFTTGMFLVADIVGGGIVALPGAMLLSGGFAGTALIITICIAFWYTGYLLGKSWNLLCRKWPNEYNLAHCRKPYPEIAYRALGERVTSCLLNSVLVGISIMYLLLSAKTANEFLFMYFGINLVMLLPITWLKSPQDFWWAIMTAMLTTTISVVLILIGSAMDFGTCSKVSVFPKFDLKNMVMSLGTFMLSFGGHGVAFSLYMPIAGLSYLTYGNSIKESILNSIQNPLLQQIANVCIGIHCVLALTIYINPVNQDLEHLFNIPHRKNQKKIESF